jgi:hypothetical protein
MNLRRLTLANCGEFEQRDAEAAPPVIDFEPDVTLIAGVIGVGKSTAQAGDLPEFAQVVVYWLRKKQTKAAV